MAPKKSDPVVIAPNTNGRNTLPNGPSGSPPSSAWRALVLAYEECKKHESHYAASEDLGEKLASTEEEVRRLTTTVETFHRCHDDMIRRLEDENARLKADLEKSRAILKSASEDLAISQQAEQNLKNDLAGMENKLLKLMSELKERDRRVIALENSLTKVEVERSEAIEKLQVSQKELGAWNAYLKPLRVIKENAIATQMEKLFNRTLKALQKAFENGASDLFLQEHRQWVDRMQRLNLDTIQVKDIYISAENSIEANNARIVVIMALIASLFTEHIFTPFLVRRDDRDFYKYLQLEAEKNSDKEALCRSLLISSYPEMESQRKEATADLVSKSILEILYPMLLDEKKNAAVSDIQGIVTTAVDFWAEAQRSRERLEASVEVDPDEVRFFNFSQKMTKENAKESGGAQSETLPDIAYLVFPSVFFISDGRWRSIYSGHAVDEKAMDPAKQEIVREVQSPALRREESGKSRRTSIASRGNAGEPPVSPSILKKLSFKGWYDSKPLGN